MSKTPPPTTEIHPAITWTIVVVVLLALWMLDQVPIESLDLSLSYGAF